MQKEGGVKKEGGAKGRGEECAERSGCRRKGGVQKEGGAEGRDCKSKGGGGGRGGQVDWSTKAEMRREEVLLVGQSHTVKL